MTRRYGDPVEVRRRDDAPAEFLWRGRLYVVREVLAHWVETDAWWESSRARAIYGEELPADTLAELRTSAGVVAAEPASPCPAYDEAADLSSGEREVWQVEASPGRLRAPGVYDLSFDWSAGVWSLTRTYD